jgi:hypothetical protein
MRMFLSPVAAANPIAVITNNKVKKCIKIVCRQTIFFITFSPFWRAGYECFDKLMLINNGLTCSVNTTFGLKVVKFLKVNSE